MSNVIKAIIFDMDGVLIDACEWHYEALNLALESYGMAISRVEHVTKYNGLPTQTKLDMLTREKGLSEGVHQKINKLKQQVTMDVINQRCQPDIQHLDTLAQLRFDGFRLAVASNSIRKTVEAMLSLAGITPWLELMLSNEDVARPKPSPDIYLKAMASLGVEPEQTLIIEDSPQGIHAAKASGAHVLEVAGVSEVSYENISRYLLGIA